MPPMTLTGARRAILRSLYVVVCSAGLAGLVTCMLPGWRTDHALGTDFEAAGGPLLAMAMIAVTCLAATGVALPRREITVLVSTTLTVLAIPLAIAMALAHVSGPGLAASPLWPARLLNLALPVVIFSGPILSALGFVLFRLEGRSLPARIPVATLR